MAAIFHMITHAFFKALLFLGSGSVIHGMHDEQDMRRMGGLRKLMPITAVTFIVGWLAIAGVPPFAGFWSKDEILLFAFAKSPALYVVGLVTALLTAYYMTRQVIMVFFGEAQWDGHSAARARRARRRSSRTRAVGDARSRSSSSPCCRRSAGSSSCRSARPPSGSAAGSHPVVEPAEGIGEAHIDGTWADDHIVRLLAIIALAVALAGIVAAYLVYQRQRVKAIEPAILEQRLVLRPDRHRVHGRARAARRSRRTAWFDANVVDGAVNGIGRAVRSAAGGVRAGAERLRARLRRRHQRRRRAAARLVRHRPRNRVMRRDLDSFPILTCSCSSAGCVGAVCSSSCVAVAKPPARPRQARSPG